MVGFRPKTSQYSEFPNISYKPCVSQLILEQCFVVLYNKCCVAGMFTYIHLVHKHTYTYTHTYTHKLSTPFDLCSYFYATCTMYVDALQSWLLKDVVGDMTDADYVKVCGSRWNSSREKSTLKQKSKNIGRRHWHHRGGVGRGKLHVYLWKKALFYVMCEPCGDRQIYNKQARLFEYKGWIQIGKDIRKKKEQKQKIYEYRDDDDENEFFDECCRCRMY